MTPGQYAKSYVISCLVQRFLGKLHSKYNVQCHHVRNCPIIFLWSCGWTHDSSRFMPRFHRPQALLLRRLLARVFTDTATALCCIVKQLGLQLRYGYE